jgi:hypothetical protein
MRFTTIEEQVGAQHLAARWLPELLSKVEAGLRDMGATPRGSIPARALAGGLENEPGLPAATAQAGEVTDPAIALCIMRGRRLMELRFEKAFEVFLTVNREGAASTLDNTMPRECGRKAPSAPNTSCRESGCATPPRLDGHLFHESYAQEKLGKIVKGRLAIVRAFARSRSHKDFMRRVDGRISRFDHIRVWGFKSGQLGLAMGRQRKS